MDPTSAESFIGRVDYVSRNQIRWSGLLIASPACPVLIQPSHINTSSDGKVLWLIKNAEKQTEEL